LSVQGAEDRRLLDDGDGHTPSKPGQQRLGRPRLADQAAKVGSGHLFTVEGHEHDAFVDGGVEQVVLQLPVIL